MIHSSLMVPKVQLGCGFFPISGFMSARHPLPTLPIESDRFAVDAKYRTHGRQFARVLDLRHGTSLTMLNSGEVLESDKAILLCFPGMGGMHSSAGSLLFLMRSLALNEAGKREYAVIGFDQPRHGSIRHHRNLQFLSLEYYMRWTDSLVQTYRRYNKPILLFGRSVGANQVLEYGKRFDGNVQGSIAMSAFHPRWLEYNLAQVHEAAARGLFRINEPAMELIYAHNNEWSWQNGAGKMPTLILHGLHDDSYPQDDARTFWPSFAQQQSSQLAFINGAKHDCFPEEQPEITAQSLAIVRRFIRDALEKGE